MKSTKYLDNWGFGLRSSSSILNTPFQKLDLFSSSRQGLRDAYCLAPLERTNPNH
jgi:hypothetical protein